MSHAYQLNEELPHASEPRLAAEAKPSHLLSPTLDFLLIGGASILCFALFYLFVDKNAPIDQISWTAFYLAFAVNNPHFMASYLLLYKDRRSEILSNPKLFWAAILAPALLLAYLGTAIALNSPAWLGYASNFMFLTVGWHYVKQIYGTTIVSAARQGYSFDKTESWLLRFSLFPLWFLSFVSGNLAARDIVQYGISYNTFAFPAWTLDVSYGLTGLGTLALATMFVRKWVRDGKRPPATVFASVAAIYVWYLPSLYHSAFWYLIPLFHSLQYMLFVLALKRNQTRAHAATFSEAPQQRLAFVKGFFGYLATIGILGYLSFKLLPETMDRFLTYDRTVFGTQLAVFCFISFINIHHYLIDNVIWRRDNPMLKRYL